ncbi:MAG: hypothetical protein OEP45_12260, partial [Acidobacteriota bacterium]|nr:hypothetical protein [Acidobacteriota bacterium]
MTASDTTTMGTGRFLRLAVLTGLVLAGGSILFPQSAHAVCGNGSIDFDEVCDDGNTADGDGCSSICQLEANSCIDDVTERSNNCTANDVRIALVLNRTDAACELGTTIDLNLIAELEATAAERWDIGMFIALDGGTARTGLCRQRALPPPLAPDLPSCEGSCSVSGAVCVKDEDCPGFVPFPGAGETCTGGYNPGTVFLNPDGTIALPFESGGPFYDGECSEDPADLCGDLEQGVTTFYEFPSPLTVPCRDLDGDGAVDIGSCLSWDNGRSDGGNKPSCLSIGDTEPNTKAKCKCETVNIGNVYVAGKIIVQKDVCGTSSEAFDFELAGGPDGVSELFTLADGEEFQSVNLKPSFLDSTNGTYSVVETVPGGWQPSVV